MLGPGDAVQEVLAQEHGPSYRGLRDLTRIWGNVARV